jgi:hypothetical protein
VYHINEQINERPLALYIRHFVLWMSQAPDVRGEFYINCYIYAPLKYKHKTTLLAPHICQFTWRAYWIFILVSLAICHVLMYVSFCNEIDINEHL